MAIAITLLTDQFTRTAGGFPSSAAMSTALWVKLLSDRNLVSAVIAWDTGVTTNFYKLITGADGTTMTLSMHTAGGTTTITGPNMEIGTWYYFGWRQSTGGAATLVWRSERDHRVTIPASATEGTATITRFWLGSDSVNFANAAIAGVKIWDAALTNDELEMESQFLQPVRRLNLHAFYPLTDQAHASADQGGVSNRGLTPGTTTPLLFEGPPVPWSEEDDHAPHVNYLR